MLLGGGASVHGADAFGGAINVITRRAGAALRRRLAVGQHELVEAAAAVSLAARPVEHVFSGEFNRSNGFSRDRDHDVRWRATRARAASGTTLSVAYLDKEFGAAGFYGTAPSREWTDQTLVTAEHRFDAARQLAAVDRRRLPLARRSLRLRLDQPGALGQPAPHPRGARPTAGGAPRSAPASQLSLGASGGRDAIDSTSLGERTFTRAGGVVELRQALGSRVVVQPGIRVDRYNRFGTAWSPAIAASGWIVPNVRWRTATGHTFRIPTYTELYYRDPNHQALGRLVPERAWSADGGVDAFAARLDGERHGLRALGRGRHRLGARRPDRALAHHQHPRRRHPRRRAGGPRRAGTDLWSVRYTGQHAEAPSLALLSKYVLDYAPNAFSLAGATTWRAWTWART